MTASPPSSGSIEATSNPRSPIFSAIWSADAGTSTNSRSQDRTSLIVVRGSSFDVRRSGSRFGGSRFGHAALAANEAPRTTNHERSTSGRKLFEKSEIVLVEQPDVFHSIPQNRDALEAEDPREAGISLRVVADRLEHRRMHHAAAAQLDPSGPLAHRAAGAVALPAAQVDFGARLGVGK